MASALASRVLRFAAGAPFPRAALAGAAWARATPPILLRAAAPPCGGVGAGGGAGSGSPGWAASQRRAAEPQRAGVAALGGHVARVWGGGCLPGGGALPPRPAGAPGLPGRLWGLLLGAAGSTRALLALRAAPAAPTLWGGRLHTAHAKHGTRAHARARQHRRGQHSGGQQYRFRQYQGWEGGPAPSRASLLVRPLLFSAAVVFGSLAAAAIWYSERRAKDHWTVRMGLQPSPRQRTEVYDLWGWRLTTGQVVAVGLVSTNILVHGLWVFARGRGRASAAVSAFLQRNFLLYPFSGRGFPLLGSAFSHVEFLHLAFNMIALWSFAPVIVSLLGPETFMATYLSSAVITSLGGMLIHLGMTVTLPSCGASGAILFLFSTSALLMPTASYRIIFLPFFAFSGPQLLAGVVALDLAGLIMGWKMFNHGAHLTGAILGVLFVNGGGALIHRYQVECIKAWRRMVKNQK